MAEAASPSDAAPGVAIDEMAIPGMGIEQGHYWEVLQALWRSGLGEAPPDHEGDLLWRSCPVADVAFFTEGYVRAWFFTSKDGVLKRKKKSSLGVHELADAFAKGQSSGHEEEVVALAVFSPGGRMDAASRAKSTVAPLERAELRWLLDHKHGSRRDDLQAILKYVKPLGYHEAVLRFDWHAHVTSYEMRSACNPIKATSSLSVVPAYVRLATHSSAVLHSQKANHVADAAVREASAVCEALAARLRPGMPRDQVRVCADFKLLGGEKIVLIWVAMPPSNVVFPATDFPASLPGATQLLDSGVARTYSARPGSARPGSARSSSARPGSAASHVSSCAAGASVTSLGGSLSADHSLTASGPIVNPQLLRPQPKLRPQSGGMERSAPMGGGLASVLNTRPASARTAPSHERRRGSDDSDGPVVAAAAASTRKPQLMCSRYFVCPGCGCAELRRLAIQPERDAQFIRAMEVPNGRPGSGYARGGLSDASPRLSARPASARTSSARRSKTASASEQRALRPTYLASARLASPRLLVHQAEGWHQAGMCIDCSKAALIEAREEQRREAELPAPPEDGRRPRPQSAPHVRKLRPHPPSAAPPPAPAAATAPMGSLAAAVAAAAMPSTPAPSEPSPQDVARDAVVAQLLAAQNTPHWLRPYFAPLVSPRH